jgi:uncharacterized protein YndB with AHSA1/START domain
MSNPSAEYAVTIDRSVEDVFAYVADGENCSAWRPGVVDIKRIGGEGLGARYAQGVRGPMGRRIAADYEVTAFEPNRHIEFQTTTGPARPHGRYLFAADGGGTRLSFALEATLDGLSGLFMGGAVQRTMNDEVRTLDNLKRVLESRSQDGPPEA